MSHRHRRYHKHESSSSSSSSSSSDSDSSCDSDTMEMLKEVARMLRRKLKKRHHSHKKVYRFSGEKSVIPVSPKSNSSSSLESSTDQMDSDRENSSASDESDVDHCGPGKIDVGGGNCVPVLQKSVLPISTGGVSQRSDNVSFSIQDKVTLLTSLDLGKMDGKIVLFYAPWCGHCKSIKPEYVKVAKKIGGLHAVNCDEDEEVATHFNIKGFPTIAYIQDNTISETYEGPRVASSMLEWVNKNKPKKSPKKKRSKAMYGVTEVAEVAESHLFNSKWIKELTASTFGKNDKVVMFYAPWCGHCKTTAPIFDSVADAMQQQLYVVNCDKESELASQQGIQGFPTIIYFKNGKRVQFGKDPRDGNRDLESIKKWIIRHSSVAVQDVPIQDVPIKKAPSSVIDINDEDSSVLQSNCIVMFHAPWCGHCKTTKPVFEKVSDKFRKMAHKIKFVMVNGDNNPELKTRYSIGGYPTILHIKDGNQIDEYDEQREIDQMSKWVQQKLQKLQK